MRKWTKRTALAALTLLVLLAAIAAKPLLKYRHLLSSTVPAPEAATGLRSVATPSLSKSAVVAAHPEAVRIGTDVLKRGGSALDAAVAIQAALTLVEPQSSGLGGGAFLLYWDAAAQRLWALDGRETAPAGASPKMFLNSESKPLSFPAAMLGGRSVGVPGVVRLLGQAHARFGKLSWRELFQEPMKLARQGFTVTPRLATLLSLDPLLPALPKMRGYFLDASGWPHGPGATLVNPQLAETFEALSEGGADAFYSGKVADQMVLAVRDAKRPSLPRAVLNLVARDWGLALTGEPSVDAPGTLTLNDLSQYKALEREPLCADYRRFRVCGLPPPAGGVSVLELLKLLEPFDLANATEVDRMHLLLQAQAVVSADRDRWIGDPAFVPVPTLGLLSDDYLTERRKLISMEHALKGVSAGTPPGATASSQKGEAFEVPSTSHFVVVDAQGSIACMTTSIEFGFGAHVMAGGFLLNNQLTDFAFTPEKDGKKVFNSVEPGKRPRSAMSPIIVFDKETGQPIFAVGSPGGPRITGYIAQALTNVLDRGLSPDEAIAAPHVVWMKGKAEVEDVGWPDAKTREALVEGLKAKGHAVEVTMQNSGLHAVRVLDGGIAPGIDPRREGAADGE